MDTVTTNILYYPMLVSEDGTNEHLSKEQNILIWGKYLGLSREKKDIITSREIIKRIQEFEKKFQLNEIIIGQISLVIRKLFFGELDLAGAEEKIRIELAKTNPSDPNQAKSIIEAIQKEVFTIKPEPEKPIEVEEVVLLPPYPVTEKLPLLKAMSQYRHLSDQILTASKIKVPGVMEPVRPSLSNWLKSYRSVLGVGVHGSAERGKFLFQSENGRKLSNEDRARLNLVLKSIEEGFPLEIDPKREMILFPSGEDVSMSVAKLGKKPATAFIRPSSFSDEQTFSRPAFLNQMPAGETKKPTLFSMTGAPEKNVAGKTLHFSTGHVLPAEKEETNISVETPSSVPQGNMLSVAPVSSMNSSPVISRTPQQSIDRNPYMIRPLRMRPSEPTSPAKQ